MKNHDLEKFFESVGQNLPLYLLSWHRNIIYDHKNIKNNFLKYIIEIQSEIFRESDLSEQYLQFSGFESISIGFPIITTYRGFSQKFCIFSKNLRLKNRFRNFQIFIFL